MAYSVVANGIVREDHTVTVTFTLPEDIPPGEVTITANVDSPLGTMTPLEFANSEFFGMWADRDDLPDTNEEFMAWRRRIWEQGPG